MSTRLQDIYNMFKAANIEVYFPQQKTGECLKEYVVIANSGAARAGLTSSDFAYYNIMCYVPKAHYSRLESFVNEIKEQMKSLYPMMVYLHLDSPSVFDDEVKAHMISIQYRNAQKYQNFKED